MPDVEVEQNTASLSRGGPVVEAHLANFTDFTMAVLSDPNVREMVPIKPFAWFARHMELAERRAETTAAVIAWLRDNIHPLTHDRGDRWPLLIWGGQWTKNSVEGVYLEDDRELWQTWIDRGLCPQWCEVGSISVARARLPMLRYFQSKGMPIILHPLGWVGAAFVDPPDGPGCAHLPPAKGMDVWLREHGTGRAGGVCAEHPRTSRGI